MRSSSSRQVVTAARPHVRRRRAANSCEACRRRKVRCDQKLPCAACVRAKVSMTCVYRDRAPSQVISDEDSQTSHLPDDSPSSGVQLGTPGTTVSQSHQSDGDLAAKRTHNEPLPGQPSLRRSLLQGGLTTPKATTSRELSQAAIPIPTPAPRLRHVADKTKMFGESHWVHLADKVGFLAMTPV